MDETTPKPRGEDAAPISEAPGTEPGAAPDPAPKRVFNFAHWPKDALRRLSSIAGRKGGLTRSGGVASGRRRSAKTRRQMRRAARLTAARAAPHDRTSAENIRPRTDVLIETLAGE